MQEDKERIEAFIQYIEAIERIKKWLEPLGWNLLDIRPIANKKERENKE